MVFESKACWPFCAGCTLVDEPVYGDLAGYGKLTRTDTYSSIASQEEARGTARVEITRGLCVTGRSVAFIQKPPTRLVAA